MAKPRDYQEEYQRRITRGTLRGLSRSQARGHPRLGESHIASAQNTPRLNDSLEEGRRRMQDGMSLTQAAKDIRVAPERLRHYLGEMDVIEKRGNRWSVIDNRDRQVQLYSNGRVETIVVHGYDASRQVGLYMWAVKQFLTTNDRSLLTFWQGQFITDTQGDRYPFETRPNVLYRLAHAGTESFEQVYKIVI